jgi:hypothetical protein
MDVHVFPTFITQMSYVNAYYDFLCFVIQTCINYK